MQLSIYSIFSEFKFLPYNIEKKITFEYRKLTVDTWNFHLIPWKFQNAFTHFEVYHFILKMFFRGSFFRGSFFLSFSAYEVWLVFLIPHYWQSPLWCLSCQKAVTYTAYTVSIGISSGEREMRVMAPQETLFSCPHSAWSAGWCSSLGLSTYALLGVCRPSLNHSHSRTLVLVQCGVVECWGVIFHRRFKKNRNLESTWSGKAWHVGIMRMRCDDQQRWLEDCTQQAKQRGWRRAAVWWSPSQHSATIGEWDLGEICFAFFSFKERKAENYQELIFPVQKSLGQKLHDWK